jgi:hypothetical protein
MSSWKQYGGTNKLDLLNNIVVNNVITDTLTLRKAYYGTFDISGVLRVGSEAYIGTTTFTQNLVASNDISGNTLHISGDSYFSGNLILKNDQYIQTGKLFINNDFDACGNVRIKQSLSLGNGGVYLNADNPRGNIGINKMNAIALLDLSGTQTTILHVYSDASVSKSVITQTREKKGIAFETNTTGTKIRIHGESDVGSANEDAIIEYMEGGYMVLDVSNQANFLSKVAISNREEGKIVGTIYNENLVVCSDTGEPHLPDVYLDPVSASSAVSLVNTDEDSMVHLNLLTNTGDGNVGGMRIGGGSYPDDVTRTMGTIGYMKNEKYTPVMNIVSGNSNLYRKSTVGVNTHGPNVDKYAVDVNGAIYLHNGEISVSRNAGFVINDMHVLSTNKNVMYAVGGPYLEELDQESNTKYRQKILYTKNGGETWIENYSLRDDTIENQLIQLNSVYVVDSSLVFIGGESGYLYYTNDGGANYYPVSDMEADNILSIYVYVGVTNYRVFIGRENSIFWFDVARSIYTDNNGISCTDIETGVISLNSITNLKHINGIGSIFYVIGNTYIEKYTILYSGGIVNSILFTSVLNTNVLNKTLNRITIYNSQNILVVGNGLVLRTTNSGTSWSSILVNANIKNVSMYSTTNYILVGESNPGEENKIYYSQNGTTIQPIIDSVLNNSGNAAMILSSAYMNACFIKDINNFMVSAYKNGGSKIYNLYLPEVFNRRQNRVLDISGVVSLTGDFEIGGGGKFVSNETETYLFDENGGNIYIGGGTSNSFVGGNLFVNNNVGVFGDVSMAENVFSHGYMEADRVGIVTDLSLGASSNLYIHGDTHIYGYVETSGDISMNRAEIHAGTMGNVTIRNKLSVLDLSVNRAKIHDISSNRIDVSNANVAGNLISYGTVKSNYIDSVNLNGDLFIGCLGLTDAASKTIYIGSDGTNTQNTTNTIRIGGPKDNIVITGQNTSVNIESLNAGPIIYLNKLDADTDVVNIGFNSSAGAGIHIVDNSDNNAGKFVVSSNMQGYIIKAPASTTKMRMDIGTMGSGIVALKPTTGVSPDSSFVMSSFGLEPENIMVRGNVVDGKQIVDMSSGFMGPVSFGKTGVNIADTAVDISGNVICSKLGVGTNNVNPDFALSVEGNVYASGYIWQF